jgi:hypothetical protein
LGAENKTETFTITSADRVIIKDDEKLFYWGRCGAVQIQL